MLLGCIALVLVTTIRVKKEKETLKHRWSRNFRWDLQSLRLEQLQEWKNI